MRSTIRAAVAFSTSSISASSDWVAPGRRFTRLMTSHCARVRPSRRTRRSNAVRIRRATSEIRNPICRSSSSDKGLPSVECLGYRCLAYYHPDTQLKAMSDDQPVDPVSVPRRTMIMLSIILGSTLYSTTLLIASTLLPQMQGAMAATQDEIAWAMTFNILATAVVTPMTGWLVARFGRRGVMVGSMLLFSLFTYLCGAADSLETLVLWRILQGAAGAPVVPLSQTILFDSFPRRQHRMITSVYGMAV